MTSSTSVLKERHLSIAENGETRAKSDSQDVTEHDWVESFRSKCMGSDPRTCAGMCMVSFAIPLLIPGITLTVVVFEDEKGFSKYSALHVIGMILLAVAILLIVAGLALCVHCQSKVSPDDNLHTISTHEKNIQNHTVSERFNSQGSYSPHLTDEIQPSAKIPIAAHYSVSQGNNTATDDIRGGFAVDSVGALPPMTPYDANTAPISQADANPEDLQKSAYHQNRVSDNSSSCSVDSDSDVSSASYSIHESEAETPFKSANSKSPSLTQKAFDWDLATAIQGNMPCPIPATNPSNFNMKSTNFFDWSVNKNKECASGEAYKPAQDNTHPEISLDEEGPTLRHRLYAVSGDLSRPTSEATQQTIRHSGQSDDQTSSISESSSSVFRVESAVFPGELLDGAPSRIYTSNVMEKQLSGFPSDQSFPKKESSRPQSDGNIRQVHSSSGRTGINSWHAILTPDYNGRTQNESDHCVPAVANASSSYQTPIENLASVSESVSDSQSIVTPLEKTSNIEKTPLKSQIQDGLNPQESATGGESSVNTCDVTYDAVETLTQMVYNGASIDNVVTQEQTLNGGKISDSTGAVTHNNTNSEFYTSSLSVFPS